MLREYKSAEGYRIIVGKNNRQNDYITTTLAAKNDLWFHTKNIPGSHVVVMCGGKEVSERLFTPQRSPPKTRAPPRARRCLLITRR